MTAAEFCTTYGITATTRRVNHNPSMPEWKDADHWSVGLARGEKGVDYAEMRTHYSKGYGHHGAPPTASEVIACLVMEAAPFGSNGRGITFEDWCAEYGYDTDSRKAERTFNACRDLSAKLREFLGAAAFAVATENGLED